MRLRMEGFLVRLAFVTQVLALVLLPAVGLLIIQWRFGAIHPYLWMSVVVFNLLAIDAGRRALRDPHRSSGSWLESSG